MRVPPFVLAAILVLLLGHPAPAATLSVSANKPTYLIGETITLTITGDDEGATTWGVFGRLLYNGALVDNGTRSQTAIVGPSGPWSKGVLNAGDTNANSPTSAFSYAFNQLKQDPEDSETANNLPGTLSTVTLIARATGIVDLAWDITDGSPTELFFFDLAYAPGTSFCIQPNEGSQSPPCAFIPEPGTALLVVAGLIGLAGWRKTRA